eukprot:5946879-Prorocentrum_lima.AAC.1
MPARRQRTGGLRLLPVPAAGYAWQATLFRRPCGSEGGEEQWRCSVLGMAEVAYSSCCAKA